MPSPHAFSLMTAPEWSFATKRGDVYKPSACPRATSASPSALFENSENLKLDEPAFSTAIASVISGAISARPAARRALCFPSGASERSERGGPSHHRLARRLAPRMGDECRNAARSKARRHRIGAARQDDRHARAEDDA